MKKIFVLGLFLLVSAFAFTAIAAPQVPEDGLKMELTKKPVIFNHSTHKDLACVDCHHQVDGKDNFQPCATAGCHDIMGAKDKSVNSYYQAMHKAKGTQYATCVSCHLEVAGDNKDLKKELAGCAKSKCHS